MALTYAQLDTLTTSAALLGRVRNALRHYANYLLSGTPTDAQKWWCALVFYNGRCAQIAADLMGQLVQDGAFAATVDPDAADVTDAAVESAVEKICMNYIGVHS